MQLQLTLLLGVLGTLPFAWGHARLMKPPSRSSMWRFGFPGAVVNYQDHENYCGGLQNQIDQGYRCGPCGDPWQDPVPRANERGGKYGQGPRVATYMRGDIIDVEVQIAVNHKGWVEFRICATGDSQTRATPDCLQLLTAADSTNTRFYLADDDKVLQYKLQLPPDLSCEWCVLQWRYHAGNNWGTDADGRSCIGCGFQEEFYGCADVAVLSHGGQLAPTHSASSSTSSPTAAPTTHQASTSFSTSDQTPFPTLAPTTHQTRDQTTFFTADHTFSSTLAPTPAPAQTQAPSFATSSSTSSPTHSPSTQASPTIAPTSARQPTDGSGCRANNIYKDTPNLNEWCKTNCAAGYCPTSHCVCGAVTRPKCQAVGEWKHIAGIRRWCQLNCEMGFCPAQKCRCTV